MVLAFDSPREGVGACTLHPAPCTHPPVTPPLPYTLRAEEGGGGAAAPAAPPFEVGSKLEERVLACNTTRRS